MKLILLLVAIYSLIFYQHYKIEKAKIALPESEPKAGKTYQNDGPVKRQEYGSAGYLIKSHYSIIPPLQIARLGFYE